jgi:hypothetical protein
MSLDGFFLVVEDGSSLYGPSQINGQQLSLSFGGTGVQIQRV